jgi:DNA-nicking Smr family endonuclease
MHQDSSNPFQQLAKAFAGKSTDSGGREVKAPQPSGVSAQQHGDKNHALAADDDAALFLNAVSRIQSLESKAGKQKPGTASLGDALAARIRENSEADKGGKKAEAAGVGVTPRENREFLAAMETSVQRPVPGHLQAASEPQSGRTSMKGTEEESQALFVRAMQGVAPVNGKGRDVAASVKGSGNAAAHDPAKGLREVLEGKVEFALHYTDEYVEGFVVGVDPLVLARLRAGQYSPEKHLDLHGMNAEQAHGALIWFIRDAYQKGLRTVVVVTGRGRNSPDGIGVLRPLLQQWLSREPFKRVVLAFCTARTHDGGPGAVYVLLRKYKKSRGKIVWERTPSDDDFPVD